MKSFIDINVDVGEGVGNEIEIIPYVSSLNIACGGHAGDEMSMKYVLELAKKFNVRVGAHPGFEDRINFGRVPLNISISELRDSLTKQLDLIRRLSFEEGVELQYIKPHGALYHLACSQLSYAHLLADLAKADLAILGLPLSVMEFVCNERKIPFIREGFADRVYEFNGSLRKRSNEGSIHCSFEHIMQQVLNLCDGKVDTFNNETIELNVDSICFHGDHKGSEKIIRKVVSRLKEKGIEIRS
ncbi:MAG: lactam utilization protein LamB [Flavobacteriales bacterium]|nr:lactam utilization protein LamB [Flavobacteriales bacterium]|tara:strand:- start:237 stop:965 length:729 start_codon:yes stop_codon:yes gene_type:complete